VPLDGPVTTLTYESTSKQYGLAPSIIFLNTSITPLINPYLFFSATTSSSSNLLLLLHVDAAMSKSFAAFRCLALGLILFSTFKLKAVSTVGLLAAKAMKSSKLVRKISVTA